MISHLDDPLAETNRSAITSSQWTSNSEPRLASSEDLSLRLLIPLSILTLSVLGPGRPTEQRGSQSESTAASLGYGKSLEKNGAFG